MQQDHLAVIDRSALHALEAVLGAERMKSFIGEYLVQAQRLDSDLRRAWSRHDWEATYRPAHNLVSNAGNFGAQKVAALADAIQHAAREHDEAALEAALEPLSEALIEAAKELKRLYPQD
jgi:HPt (histidine-containing phosphotransfer) domain-containing protein